MSVSGVSATNYTAKTQTAKKEEKTTAPATTEVVDSFEKSTETAKSSTSKTYTRDTAKLAELKASDKAYLQTLQGIVNQLVTQVGKGQSASGASKWQAPSDGIGKVDSYFDFLVDNKDGTYSFKPGITQEQQDAIIAKAKEDISENGYYGVKQTSQRILDFAKAITGGDPSKIESMRKMAQEAFDSVAKICGGKLPKISQDTYDAVMKGFDEWAASAAE